MKIKNFVKYFKEGVVKYFKISVKFLNISKWNISSCISSCTYELLPRIVSWEQAISASGCYFTIAAHLLRIYTCSVCADQKGKIIYGGAHFRFSSQRFWARQQYKPKLKYCGIPNLSNNLLLSSQHHRPLVDIKIAAWWLRRLSVLSLYLHVLNL